MGACANVLACLALGNTVLAEGRPANDASSTGRQRVWVWLYHSTIKCDFLVILDYALLSLQTITQLIAVGLHEGFWLHDMSTNVDGPERPFAIYLLPKYVRNKSNAWVGGSSLVLRNVSIFLKETGTGFNYDESHHHSYMLSGMCRRNML